MKRNSYLTPIIVCEEVFTEQGIAVSPAGYDIIYDPNIGQPGFGESGYNNFGEL